MMSVPVCAMVTPDLVEASDAGRAGWCACCRRGRTAGETVGCGARSPPPALPDAKRLQAQRMQQSTGTQLLANIL